MADIVNLRLARKTRARAKASAQAEANRRKFGRTKAEKAQDANDRALVDRALDRAKRGDS